jgi:hypothetical protein
VSTQHLSSVNTLAFNKSKIQKALYWFTYFSGLMWSVYVWLNSAGTPVQDEIGHFLFSRSAWQYPVLILNLWGRPANTLFYMLPAIGGLAATRFFSIMILGVAVLLATLLARKLGITWLFLIPLMVWFQPWVAELSGTVITEVPFLLFLILGLYLASAQHMRSAALFFGLLPLVRYEGIVLTFIWILYAGYKKKWPAISIAVIPFAIYNFVYYLVLQRWAVGVYLSAQPTNLYGAGGWFHFVPALVSNVGLPLVVLSCLAFFVILRLKAQIFVFVPYALYFLVHVVLFRFGLYASGGYDLFLLPLAPAFGLAAALGLEFIRDRLFSTFSFAYIRSIIYGFAVIVCVGLAVYGMLFSKLRSADPEEAAAKQIADWLHLHNLNALPVVWTHIWFPYYYTGFITPQQGTSRPPEFETIEPGTILVWDRHYSPRWGYMYDRLTQPQSGWLMLFESEEQIFAAFQKQH